MTSDGLGEMFEGDSADTCAGKFPLTSMGAERRVSRAQTRERGHHRREQNFVDTVRFNTAQCFTISTCLFSGGKNFNKKVINLVLFSSVLF